MTERIVVTDLTADVAELTDDLARVYREAFCVPPYDEPPESAERFVAEQLPAHAVRAGFRLVGAVAVPDDERAASGAADDAPPLRARHGDLLGFAYGYTGERGQWWSDWVAATAPEDVVGTWIGEHFEVVEIAVRASAQGQGLGGRLHDALLADLPHERALLTTYRADRPAPRLYRRKGWQVLVADLDAENALYGLDLRARAGAPSGR
ncbi:GNAT family N-acetyltransferase [Kineosporia sp. R_H_3]|uniref:GNAT family N-acetyltransferase n=1 Tax=Kineosporia sp. R_H_3 TaxID=1961848 RepID=UPI000B4BE2A9|nr:GNAT family N-acetyltransferase [Kineosporia sp. R_H_3]